MKSISDHEHRELLSKEVYDIFVRDFVNIETCVKAGKAIYTDLPDGNIECVVKIKYDGRVEEVRSVGNGRLDAVSGAVKSIIGRPYSLETYSQHAVEGKTTSDAASYVSISSDGKTYWGTGIDSDIT